MGHIKEKYPQSTFIYKKCLAYAIHILCAILWDYIHYPKKLLIARM